MKRKTIAILTNELSQKCKEYDELYSESIKNRRNLTDAFQEGKFYYRSQEDLKSWEEILSLVLKLIGEVNGMKRKEGEMLPWIREEQSQTNAKLWYLLRTAMDDKTLRIDESNYINYQTGEKTPFKKPTF